MAPSSAQIRTYISQFVAFTGASERTAATFLKASGYRVNEAVDEYFHQAGGTKGTAAGDPELNSLFDGLRDASSDAKDSMELDSTMEYLNDILKVNMENAELFVALEQVQAPTIGEITRKGYVEGWQASGVPATHQKHAAHIKRLTAELATDITLFKKVYKYAFVVGREKDQKSLSLENALVYWNLLFAAPGMEWKNEHRDWFELWKSFLDDKWTRSVNRDMWNMTLEFAIKSIDDDTISFWNEDGAWPSVIDDFVEWCRAKGIGKPEQMEVDVDE